MPAILTSSGAVVTVDGRPLTVELQQAIQAAPAPPPERILVVPAPDLTLAPAEPMLLLEA